MCWWPRCRISRTRRTVKRWTLWSCCITRPWWSRLLTKLRTLKRPRFDSFWLIIDELTMIDLLLSLLDITWAASWPPERYPSLCAWLSSPNQKQSWDRLWKRNVLPHIPTRNFCFFWLEVARTDNLRPGGRPGFLGRTIWLCRRWVGEARGMASWGGILLCWVHWRWVVVDLLEDAILILKHFLHAGGGVEHGRHWDGCIAEI